MIVGREIQIGMNMTLLPYESSIKIIISVNTKREKKPSEWRNKKYIYKHDGNNNNNRVERNKLLCRSWIGRLVNIIETEITFSLNRFLQKEEQRMKMTE